MKIIRIVSELNFGGVEKVVQLASEGFSGFQDVDFSVVVLGRGGRIADEMIRRGYKVMILNQKPKIPNVKLIRTLRGIFKEAKPDVIHTAGAEANFHGLIAAKLAGVPVRIGEEIGFPKHHFLWEQIFRLTYLCAHRVIVISKAVQDYLVENGEVPKSKTTVIYNPSRSPEIHKALSLTDKVFTFIMVCRLTDIKNIPNVIRSLKQIIFVTEYKPRLVLLGDGEEKENLKQLVIELEIEGQVSFVGFQAEVGSYLSKSDVFMIPSFSEGSSVALAEAMMMGLPSIITQVGGASEIIGDSHSAITVDPHNPQTIENAMLTFLQMDPEKRMAMGERAKKEAERFSVERYVGELKRVYNTH